MVDSSGARKRVRLVKSLKAGAHKSARATKAIRVSRRDGTNAGSSNLVDQNHGEDDCSEQGCDGAAPDPTEVGPAAPYLNCVELRYVSGLKRKEREDIVRLLGVGTGGDPVPLRIKLLESSLPERCKVQIFHSLSGRVTDKYIQWVTRLMQVPFGVYHPCPRGGMETVLRKARERMDAVIVGQEAAKREVLKMVAQCKANPTLPSSAYCLGLEGPPGCGKTQFVKQAMSAALKRPVVSIPLGGANDGAAFLLGHNYTYEGSKEGRLVSGLVEAACCNPIVFLDEVDKVSAQPRGPSSGGGAGSGTSSDVVSTLIHLVDPSTNFALRDRYFHDVDIDFSKCIFVFSFNDASLVDNVLLNRMKRVVMDTPVTAERVRISRECIVPRVQSRLRTSVTLSDETLEHIVARCSGESGMRDVERAVDHVLCNAILHTHLSKTSGDAVTSCLVHGRDVVMEDFARVATAELSRRERAPSPPPESMYT